jgi:hypothetical protein
MASICENKGENNEALSLYKESLQISKQLGDQRAISYRMKSIGAMMINLANYPVALQYIFRANNILEQLGDPYAEETSHNLTIIRV